MTNKEKIEAASVSFQRLINISAIFWKDYLKQDELRQDIQNVEEAIQHSLAARDEGHDAKLAKRICDYLSSMMLLAGYEDASDYLSEDFLPGGVKRVIARASDEILKKLGECDCYGCATMRKPCAHE